MGFANPILHAVKGGINECPHPDHPVFCRNRTAGDEKVATLHVHCPPPVPFPLPAAQPRSPTRPLHASKQKTHRQAGSFSLSFCLYNTNLKQITCQLFSPLTLRFCAVYLLPRRPGGLTANPVAARFLQDAAQRGPTPGGLKSHLSGKSFFLNEMKEQPVG